jgi:hypothetical protein
MIAVRKIDTMTPYRVRSFVNRTLQVNWNLSNHYAVESRNHPSYYNRYDHTHDRMITLTIIIEPSFQIRIRSSRPGKVLENSDFLSLLTS